MRSLLALALSGLIPTAYAVTETRVDTTIGLPINQAPAHQATAVSKTPELSAQAANVVVESGAMASKVGSQWLLYPVGGDGDVTFLGGHINAVGSDFLDTVETFQIVDVTFPFLVGDQRVLALGVSANGVVELYNNRTDKTVLGRVDFNFSDDASPQDDNAFVLHQAQGSAHIFQWPLKSQSGRWSKTLEIVVANATSGIRRNSVLVMRMEAPAFTDAFFAESYDSDIGFETLSTESPTFWTMKDTIVGFKNTLGETEDNFALVCTIEANGRCAVTPFGDSDLQDISVPEFQRFNDVSPEDGYALSLAQALEPGTMYAFQVRDQINVSDGGVTLASSSYSRWSEATTFTTEVDNSFAVALGGIGNLSAGQTFTTQWTVRHQGNDAGENVQLEIRLPFSTLDEEFLPGTFAFSLDGNDCSLSASNGRSTVRCQVDNFAVGAQKTLDVSWAFPAASEPQTYTIGYQVCDSRRCADTSFLSETISVARTQEGATTGGTRTNLSNTGAAYFLLLLLPLLLRRRY